MATSLVSKVLEIELEAENIIAEMRVAAVSRVEQAGKQCEAEVASSQKALANEVKKLEAAADGERASKAQELAAVGEASLAVVNDISEATYKKAVKMLLHALTGK